MVHPRSRGRLGASRDPYRRSAAQPAAGLQLRQLHDRPLDERRRSSNLCRDRLPSCAIWVWDVPRDEDPKRPKDDWSFRKTGTRRIPSPSIRFIDVVHPDDRESLHRALRGALEGDGQYETEYRVMSPDSTVHWIAARGRIEFDQNGKPRQLRAISIDITERRRAEDEARDLNGRLITAHEDERARLAHALHDDVTQRLALLAIDAGQKEKGLGDPIAGQAMRSIRHDLVQLSGGRACAVLRAASGDSRRPRVGRGAQGRVRAVRRRAGIPTSFRATGDIDEPTQALSLCLCRVAQEALRNVARHSGASSVKVEVRAVGSKLELAVEDNGVGFDPTRKQARGRASGLPG